MEAKFQLEKTRDLNIALEEADQRQEELKAELQQA